MTLIECVHLQHSVHNIQVPWPLLLCMREQSYMDVLGGKPGLENAINNFQDRLLVSVEAGYGIEHGIDHGILNSA